MFTIVTQTSCSETAVQEVPDTGGLMLALIVCVDVCVCTWKENIKKENFDELGFYEDRIKNTEDTDKFIVQQKSKKIK